MWVRVIADDLTGACDVGAALRPLVPAVVIESIDAMDGHAGGGALLVRNTQSRTLAPAAAAARVRAALADAPAARDGIVLKKIDTALRGPLGAEIDAAMDAVGAALAVVLPAIPEVGRTTVGGRQLIDGVPVAETAFARDPQNPVRESRVAAAIEATSTRRIAGVPLADVRSDGIADAVARCRAEGASVIVGDAETDRDLEAWVAAMCGGGMHDARPLVLAGSTGLARACRSLPREAWASSATEGTVGPRSDVERRGILVVSGSAHPATRAQLAHAARAVGLTSIVVDVGRAAETGIEAAPRLADDGVTALVAPDGEVAGGSARVLAAVATAAAAALGRACPRALVLVGGETAFAVLATLGHPRLRIDGAAPAPLVARATILDGAVAGTRLVTKGGSSGPPERLSALLAEVPR